MLSNCMSMAMEEERVLQVRVAKLEGDLQMLRLEVIIYDDLVNFEN